MIFKAFISVFIYVIMIAIMSYVSFIPMPRDILSFVIGIVIGICIVRGE